MKQIMSQRYDWSIFDHDEYRYGKITGTTMLLNAYGRINKCGWLYIFQKVQEQVDTDSANVTVDKKRFLNYNNKDRGKEVVLW